MARSENQKLKLLYLARFLSERSDEDHTFSINEMIAYLEKQDIRAERKSIYDDLSLLSSFGYDIIRRKDASKTGYYLGSRDFELAELKFLVDSVQSSKFLTEKKTASLIKKIESLASENEAKALQSCVYIHDRVKAQNEGVYIAVDALFRAITSGRAVRFKYFEYTVTKTRRFRRNGEYYVVSPYALFWEDENYYLLAWDDDAGIFKHFRVDKMTEVSPERTPRKGADEYAKLDIPQYQKKVFGMYGGKVETVRLNCEQKLAGAVIDRFGSGVKIAPEEDGTITVTVDVGVSPTFFAWVSTFGGDVRVVYPESVRQEFKKHINAILRKHK